MKQKPILVIIAILTTITIIFWVGYEIYGSFQTTPTLDVPTKILEEIDPQLDIQTLEGLKERIYFAEGDVPTPPPDKNNEESKEETILLEESTEPETIQEP